MGPWGVPGPGFAAAGPGIAAGGVAGVTGERGRGCRCPGGRGGQERGVPPGAAEGPAGRQHHPTPSPGGGGGAGTTELTGSTNLITHYNLEHAYNKFCGKKVKEKLSNFLPDLPGMIDLPGSHDNSSLRSLIEKPPICGSSFTPLTGTMLTGFRLHAGPVSAGAGGRPLGLAARGPADRPRLLPSCPSSAG